MQIWSIQTPEAFETLLDNKRLWCPESFADQQYLRAYRWMANHMKLVIGYRDGIEMPLWGWYQYENERKRKPDLRCSGHLPTGTAGVRIELKIPDELVLLSDFDLWHFVLNCDYLPLNEADMDQFSRQYPDYHRCWDSLGSQPKVEYNVFQSWKRIFDVRTFDSLSEIPFQQKQIQATFWEVDTNWITKVDRFIAR